MKNTEIFFKFIKNDDKKIEKIAPGITGYRPNIDVQIYSESINIDGLSYKIDLAGQYVNSENLVYNLGFCTEEYDEGLTNKGIGTYNKIIDAIVEMITILHQERGINIIKFNPSKFSFSPEQIKKVEQILKTAYIKNKDSFNGFSYKNEKYETMEICESSVWTCKNQINKSYELEDIFKEDNFSVLYKFDGKGAAIALLKYLGDDSGLTDELHEKRADEQRKKLYERTLKTRFPGLTFEEKKDGIYLYLDSLDKIKS